MRLRDMRIPCSAFVIDRRYGQDRADPAVEHHSAVSFGANITDTFGAILAPPIQQGPYVLALHVVSTESGLLYPVDKWYDSRPYGAELSQTAATAAASAWLAELNDAHYEWNACDDSYPHPHGPVLRSESAHLGDFIVDFPGWLHSAR